MSGRSTKRARVEEDAGGVEEQDLRVSEELRGLLNGRKYIKQKDLSRKVMLAYLIEKGDLVAVNWFVLTFSRWPEIILRWCWRRGRTCGDWRS